MSTSTSDRVWLKAEKIRFLKEVNIFHLVREENLASLADSMHVMEVDAGRTLVFKGHLLTRLIILAEGQLRIETGKSSSSVEPGTSLGGTACLAPQIASYTLKATAPSIVLSLEHEDLFMRFLANEALARSIIFSLCQQIQQLETKGDTP